MKRNLSLLSTAILMMMLLVSGCGGTAAEPSLNLRIRGRTERLNPP